VTAGRLTAAGAVLLLASLALAGAARSAESGADAKLLEKGRSVWLTAGGVGCAGCHGRFGEGDVGIGPYNRGVGASKIKEAIANVPQMRVVKGLAADEIEAVTAYNTWLGEHQLVKTLVKREKFEPSAVDIHPGTPVQLAINNSGQTPRKFAAPGMNVAQFEVPGRTVHDLVWRAPEQEGTYALRCVDCGAQGQEFTINVRTSAKPYLGPEKPEKK
jgi:mono/diheme cytochrome c family protein